MPKLPHVMQEQSPSGSQSPICMGTETEDDCQQRKGGEIVRAWLDMDVHGGIMRLAGH
jgi:hypothetical protein